MSRPQLRQRGRHPSAFSVGELLVVLGILAILAAIFVPYLSSIREVDRRTRCVDNLRAIGLALSQYAATNAQDYPRVTFDPKARGYAAFTGAESPDPFAPGTKVQPNDVTASLWLLVRGGLVEPYRFVCPGADDTPDPLMTDGRRVPPGQRSNFSAPRHLSYGYAVPFSRAPRFRLNRDVIASDFIVLGDKGPGASAARVPADAVRNAPMSLAAGNSPNHGRAGQNVLNSLLGNVDFRGTPYCGFGQGWQRDNVYAAYAADPLPEGAKPPPEASAVYSRDVLPAWEGDTFLAPAAGE